MATIVIVFLSGCAATASNPNNALIRAKHVNTADLKYPANFRSYVITIVGKDGKEMVVDNGVFGSKFIEVPPGRYTITYACVPGTYSIGADLKSYANLHKGSSTVKTKDFDLKPGEIIRTDHSHKRYDRCGLNMINCTGACL